MPGEANERQIASHAYMFHANPTPEMTADELVRRMWDEELTGITDQNKPLTTQEMLVARKVAESRRYTDGRYEVATPWTNDEPPLHCNRKSAEDRLYSLE